MLYALEEVVNILPLEQTGTVHGRSEFSLLAARPSEYLVATSPGVYTWFVESELEAI